MDKSPFIQKHSVSIRIWHWLVFVVISFLIITVLFNSTLFNPRANISMVKKSLQEKNVVVTDEQARAVAHDYEDKLWDLHKYLGFGLIFLYLSRVVIEIVLSKEEKARTKIKNAFALYKENPSDKKTLKHYIAVRYTYLAFYLLVLYMGITGFLLAFGSNLELSRETHHFIKEVHGFGQYLMYAFIVVHIGGVIIADIKHSKGLISGMVNGGE